jgi:hypothetical protein
MDLIEVLKNEGKVSQRLIITRCITRTVNLSLAKSKSQRVQKLKGYYDCPADWGIFVEKCAGEKDC